MACMEHACKNCEEVWFDNRYAFTCPICGSNEVTNWFDEVVDDEGDCEYGENEEDYDD